MKYITIHIDCKKEERKDLFYFMNTGKRRSSLYNLFLYDNLNENTTNKNER